MTIPVEKIGNRHKEEILMIVNKKAVQFHQ